jgi:ABC-type spermidine/putrescine transport system permease subunit II
MATRTEPRAGGLLDRILAMAATLGYRALVYATILFLLSPLIVVVLISFQTKAYAAWPPGSFALEWYTTKPEYTSYLGIEAALLDSLLLALATATVSTVVGGLAAYAIVRYEFPYSTSLETVLISPLI